MSIEKNRYQAERWLQTAKEDLQVAEILSREGMYAAACFHAQQGGEKAVKAVWYLLDADPWGHSIQRLLLEIPARKRIPDLET